MIECKHLFGGYESVPVLYDISLAFPPGCVTVILGPNGCGKSTLLRTACGLQPPSGGEVLLDGAPLSSFSPRRAAQKIAYMPQSRNVPHITALRMVLHGRFPYLSYPRRYRAEDFDAAGNALHAAGASDLADRPVSELSGGQRQKVYLAMALAQDTETILMDEPAAWLDIRHQLELMRTVRKLAGQNKAVVLVLHDLGLAMRTADRIAVLETGHIAQYGTPGEIYASGILNRVFGIHVSRVPTPQGFFYYCDMTENEG